tara:strand:- start:1569 stop:1706 length:138 start_codon:yes stop_codon:yes gene_type:complete
VQDLLDEGYSPREIEDITGIFADTIRRAINRGALVRVKKKESTLT